MTNYYITYPFITLYLYYLKPPPALLQPTLMTAAWYNENMRLTVPSTSWWILLFPHDWSSSWLKLFLKAEFHQLRSAAAPTSMITINLPPPPSSVLSAPFFKVGSPQSFLLLRDRLTYNVTLPPTERPWSSGHWEWGADAGGIIR